MEKWYQPGKYQLVRREDIQSIHVFPFPCVKERHELDKAEDLAIRDDNKLLMSFDSLDEERKIGKYKVIFDLIQAEA